MPHLRVLVACSGSAGASTGIVRLLTVLALSERMRICKIWDADYPWDVRVAKVASSLTSKGHDVHLVARNNSARAVREVLPEATVHRLRAWPIGRKLSAATMFPAFFNPRWASAIAATGRQCGAEVLLVRDLPLAPTAIAIARLLEIPCVLDMAENYPAMMQSLYDNQLQKPFDYVVRNPRIVAALERWVLRRIDKVAVVVEESAARLRRLGVAESRMALVGNTPPLARVESSGGKVHRDGVLHLNYLGLLEGPRGLGTVLQAVALGRERGLSLRLSVIGGGRESAVFRRQAAELSLGADIVQFHGFIPNADALRLVGDADVGLVPHHATESWNTTIPNKLFDYMAAGLAVISSDAAPAARVVHETGAGAVYAHDDPDALAQAFAQMACAAVRAECGRRGREAVRVRYHWELDAARLEALLHDAISERR